MKLLVTGFGPFRNVTDNPSAKLAAALPGTTEVLPVQYGKVESFAKSARSREEGTILCLGLNANAGSLKFELYAHNQIGAEKGHGSRAHRRTVIKSNGPKTLGQTLLTPLQLSSLHLGTSFTPGDYLCNFLLYSLLARYPDRRVGFVHVPPFETVPFDEQIVHLSRLIQMLEPS
jgi:pyrrolidone-carboxylate peptidase